ncbi:hypothetical protein I6E31_04500 [Fusobacterium varium]|nr:hypothetical protein [Fusobacterium varium]
MDFSKFENRYKITGELIVLTALHIGSGKEGENHDSPFMSLEVNGEKLYYIPGSSFRGYLSTKLERFLEEDNGIVLKDKNTNDKLNSADVKLIFGYTNLDGEKDEVKNRVAKKLGYKDLKQIDSFKSMAGRIHIADMKILSEVDSIKRDGIKIDRNTGATEKGAKFDYDVLPSGTKFEFVMELENLEKYQINLVALALQDILEGDLFGGKLSRGIGKCRLDIDKIEYVDKSNLKDYLFKRKMGTLKKEDFLKIDDIDLVIE